MVSKACYVSSYRKKLEELAALGVDLTLLAPPYWRNASGRHPFEEGNQRGYRTVLQDPVLNGNFHLHFYPGISALIEETAPDLVHIDEEPYDLVSFHALTAARRAGASGLFFTWQNIPRRYPPPFSLFESRVFRHSRAAIAGSKDAATVLREKGYRLPVYVIPQFGFDPELFPYRAPEPVNQFTEGRPFRIGFSGRFVEEKGLLVLLRAAQGLKKPWELRLLGDGPFRESLARQAASLGLSQRIRFLGAVPSDQVAAHLKNFDVLVNPSLTWHRGGTRWKEQFGRSLVEAMACGVPVVGSDSGEIPHVIGDAGTVVPEGNSAALQKVLHDLMASPEQRLSLSEKGRARANAHFTQRRIAEQTYAVYQQLLDGS